MASAQRYAVSIQRSESCRRYIEAVGVRVFKTREPHSSSVQNNSESSGHRCEMRPACMEGRILWNCNALHRAETGSKGLQTFLCTVAALNIEPSKLLHQQISLC
jgi:hypothetical protein